MDFILLSNEISVLKSSKSASMTSQKTKAWLATFFSSFNNNFSLYFNYFKECLAIFSGQ